MRWLIFLFVSLNSSANIMECNFSEIGSLKIEVSNNKAKVCVLNKNGSLQESGVSTSVSAGKLNFRTDKRDFELASNGSSSEVTWVMASHFGPLIRSGVAYHYSGACKMVEGTLPCNAKEFKNPANTPTNFDGLQTILNQNETDLWGAKPTFTLVSKDLSDFIVVTKTDKQTLEIYDQNGGSETYIESDLLNEKVYPKIKNGWTLVDVYSNAEGKKYFSSLKVK